MTCPFAFVFFILNYYLEKLKRDDELFRTYTYTAYTYTSRAWERTGIHICIVACLYLPVYLPIAYWLDAYIYLIVNVDTKPKQGETIGTVFKQPFTNR